MTPEEFLEDLRYEGICYGVLEDEIRQGLGGGYFHDLLLVDAEQVVFNV